MTDVKVEIPKVQEKVQETVQEVQSNTAKDVKDVFNEVQETVDEKQPELCTEITDSMIANISSENSSLDEETFEKVSADVEDNSEDTPAKDTPAKEAVAKEEKVEEVEVKPVEEIVVKSDEDGSSCPASYAKQIIIGASVVIGAVVVGLVLKKKSE